MAHLEFLLERNICNAVEFSWNGIISNIESNHDGVNRKYRLRSFFDVLRKYQNIYSWTENWRYLLEAIDEFAELKNLFIYQNGVTPLINFRQELKSNPSPTR